LALHKRALVNRSEAGNLQIKAR